MEVLSIIIAIIVIWYIIGSIKTYTLRTVTDEIVHVLTWFGTRDTEKLSYEKVKELLVQQDTLFQEKNSTIKFQSPKSPDWMFFFDNITSSLTAQNCNIDSPYFDIKVQLYNGRIRTACYDTGSKELRYFMYWMGKKGIQEVQMGHLI